MRSDRPKVLHSVAALPMLGHVLRAVEAAGISKIAVVMGPERSDVAKFVASQSPSASVHVQTERRGTAHAVLAARKAIAAHPDHAVLVLFGDTPLITPETIKRLCAEVFAGSTVAVLGFRASDPQGYGRLIEKGGRLSAIVEHKDASATQRKIKFCNAGLMALAPDHALSILEAIKADNAQKEFYLTDAVSIAVKRRLKVTAIEASEEEVMGVNDRRQLAVAEGMMQKRLRDAAMLSGVTMTDPQTVTLAFDTQFGRDVTIEPHVVFGKGVRVGSNVTIKAFSHLEGATIGNDVQIGPFARLRPGTEISPHARIGNFVEIKEATIGDGAKVNHLSYVGDAIVGAAANIGAGTITCNYDGFTKSRTEIGPGAFIGSNTALVAPVTVGAGAIVGAGSVITKRVSDDALAVARGHQTERAGWAKRFRAFQAERKKATP